jgi:hypothetical protein
MNDNDDEGFINMDFEKKEPKLMLDQTKQCKQILPNEQILSTTSKSIHNKPCHYPYSTRNPYDDGLFFCIFFLLLLINN